VRRLALALWLALAVTSAEAALPVPPFELTLSSTSLTEGDTVTVRVAPRPGATGGEPYDLYVLLASVEEAAFLTPEGAWAPRPVPYARALSVTAAPIVRPWPKVWPSGRFALGLVVVPPGVDPLARADWRYRPTITWFDVAPLRRAETPPAGTMPALLAVAAAAAFALVWWAGRARA
jgi:hypothetical protein